MFIWDAVLNANTRSYQVNTNFQCYICLTYISYHWKQPAPGRKPWEYKKEMLLPLPSLKGLYCSIDWQLWKHFLYRWGKALSISQWWVELAVVTGSFTRGWVSAWWCTGRSDHWTHLTMWMNMVKVWTQHKPHIGPKHVPCQVKYVLRLSVISTEVKLDMFPCGVNRIGVSTSACPWQKQIVSAISADTQMYSNPWNTTHVQSCAEHWCDEGSLHTWLWRAGRSKRRAP